MSDKLFDCIVLSEAVFVNETEGDWYHQNVLTEQELMLNALKAKGLNVKKVAWDDPDFDWSSTKTVLIREIWDYFFRFQEFSAWMDSIEDKTILINPIDQIRWNIDKHYLADIENKGINIVPSHFIETGDTRGLRAIHEELGWVETVLKPVVSGAARHTYRLNPGNYDQVELIFEGLLKNESFMIQPFMKNILSDGEVSHMVYGGKYSHSILKKAKEGDYRVQDDHGGTLHEYDASSEEIEFAESVAKACDPLPVYARIDVVKDNDGELAVGEVELIEPELWFRKKPEAADLLAEVIVGRYFS